jgi:hypothetical protein
MTGNAISQDKKEIIRNLYLSGIGEEFIAMQLDLEIGLTLIFTTISLLTLQ